MCRDMSGAPYFMETFSKGGGGVTPIDPVLPPATGVKILDCLF